MRIVAAAGWLLVTGACGGADTARECNESSECLQAGIGGSCLASPRSGRSWCAFPDPGCPSGQRWGTLAGDELARDCVDDSSDGGVPHDAPSPIDGRGGDSSPVDGGADAAQPDAARPDQITAPRQIAPLSTALATSRRPSLRWELSAGTDGAVVRLCRDRALTVGCVESFFDGSAGAPGSDLLPGTWFWRLQGRAGGIPGSAASPVWQLRIGVRTASTANTSWGSVPDLNGDGRADLAIAAGGADGNVGRVRLYLATSTGLPTSPSVDLLPPDTPTSGTFGNVTASAGDVNGDGFVDLLVGAPGVNSGEGRVYVYAGTQTGVSANPWATIAGLDGTDGLFGSYGAGVGDVNGDGYADFVVCGGGSGYVFYGDEMPLLGMPDALERPCVMGPTLGAGDLNGDGLSDLVAGNRTANGYDGEVYVYPGTPGGLATAPAMILQGTSNEHFGNVAAVGDVNGDGFADVVVGAPEGATFGRAYVFHGSAGGLATTPAMVIENPSTTYPDKFGTVVASVGDLDRNGYADLVIGARSGDYEHAYVYLTGSSGIPSAPSRTLNDPNTGTSGFPSAIAGFDIDGDGFSDLAIGAPGANDNAGRVHYYPGSASGVLSSPSLTLEGLPDAWFGTAIAR